MLFVGSIKSICELKYCSDVLVGGYYNSFIDALSSFLNYFIIQKHSIVPPCGHTYTHVNALSESEINTYS